MKVQTNVKAGQVAGKVEITQTQTNTQMSEITIG